MNVNQTARRILLCVALAGAAIQTVVVSAATAALPTKRAFYGHPSRATAVYFEVSRGGRTLKEVFLSLEDIPCSNGRSAMGTFGDAVVDQGPPWRLRVAPDGSFSGTFAVSQEYLELFTASEEYWLSGTFIRHGKAAQVVARARKVGEGGTVCDSGDRRVILRRKREPFL